MQTQTLAMDWIFQPAKWQPLRWVAEWLREQSARQRERRQAPRRRVANLAANYLDGTGAARLLKSSCRFLDAPAGCLVRSHPPRCLRRPDVARRHPACCIVCAAYCALIFILQCG